MGYCAHVSDELRIELGWANDNAWDLPAGRGATTAFRHITSMSLDATARDFQVNAVPDSTVDRLRDEFTDEDGSRVTQQRSLF